MYLGTRLTEASVRKRFCNRRDILFIIIIKTRPYFYTYYNYILNINITLCSLDRFRGMVDVYNYIVRVVNILTFVYLVRRVPESQTWQKFDALVKKKS